MSITINRNNVVISLIVAILAALGLASMVSAQQANAASYTRVLPNGLSGNKTEATKLVQELVTNDRGVQERLAHDLGLTPEQVAGAKVTSVTSTKVTIGKDADNSARMASTGDIVPSSYMNGQTVAAWKVTLKINASKTIVTKWKRDCSNPFLPKGKKKPPLRIAKKSKVFTMKFAKTKTTTQTGTCKLTGQQVKVTVVSRVTGTVRVKSVTAAVKLVSQKLTAQVKVDVVNKITLVCLAPTSPQTTTAPPALITCESMGLHTVNTATGIACQANSSSENSSEDAKVNNDCKGPNSSSQQCVTTIIQITNQTTLQFNGNCSKFVVNYSDGSQKVEFHDNGGNVVSENYCSTQTQTTPPPPSTQVYSATVTVSATASANATVACPSGSASASASATASASASASGSATSMVSQEDANNKANANAQAAAKANAYVLASASAMASASAKCVPKSPPTGKDPSKGPGTTTPGQPGGTGSSGTPGSGDGSKCRNNAGDIVDGKADQFGYCSTV